MRSAVLRSVWGVTRDAVFGAVVLASDRVVKRLVWADEAETGTRRAWEAADAPAVGSTDGSGFTPGVFSPEFLSPDLRVLWESAFGLAAVRAAGDGLFGPEP